MSELLDTIAAPDGATLARLHADLARRAEAAGLLDVAYRTVDSPLGELLQKPLDMQALRSAVRRLLDATVSRPT